MKASVAPTAISVDCIPPALALLFMVPTITSYSMLVNIRTCQGTTNGLRNTCRSYGSNISVGSLQTTFVWLQRIQFCFKTTTNKNLSFAGSILGGRTEPREDCGKGKFRCPNSGVCIPDEFKCDGEYDCDPLVGWDERNCRGP